MDFVVVVMMGGAKIVYEQGSTYRTNDRWLTVCGKSGSPVASFPEHRVVRVYYTDDAQIHWSGVAAIQAVGL